MGRKPSGSIPPRERILRAAEHLFIQQGYRNTTIRQIAAEAGVGISNIYYYFRNKYEIFYTLITEPDYLTRFSKLILAFFDENVFPEHIERLGKLVQEVYEENKSYFILLTIDALEFSGKHSAMAVNFFSQELYDNFITTIREKFKDRIREDIDVYFVMRLIIQVYFNYFITEDLYGGHYHLGYPHEKTIELIATVLKEGFLKK